jgi:hypothetical protein
MTKIWYFLSTFAESGLAVFGIRGPYEQPSYQVLQQIGPGMEMRHYEARMAVETAMTPGNEGAAFGRLFRYITGANAGGHMISMTAPVMEQPMRMAMTVPVVSSTGDETMKFFLPASVASAGPPAPTDPLVHVVSVPAVTLGVVRFSGIASAESRAAETARLRGALARAGKKPDGAPIYLSYDPPFTIPFLRRNEVALVCSN